MGSNWRILIDVVVLLFLLGLAAAWRFSVLGSSDRRGHYRWPDHAVRCLFGQEQAHLRVLHVDGSAVGWFYAPELAPFFNALLVELERLPGADEVRLVD